MKKQSERPADPVILKGPNAGNGEVVELPPNDAPETLKLQAFPDGAVFKYCPHPDEPNTFAIFGPDLKPVAFLENPALARLFCDAVRMVFAAAEQFKVARRPDNAKSRAEDAATDREHAASLADQPPEHCAATRGAVRETEELQDLDPRNPKGN